MLAPMRYKSFVWPNNPKHYSISFERQTALHKIPHGTYILEDLGRSCRCMRGQGEFFGPEAYETFKKLANVFYEEGPGVLFHPTWMTTAAYFTQLQLTQEPRTDYVAYAFTFVEGVDEVSQMTLQQASASQPTQERYHTVSAGESLWSVAQQYGVQVSRLLALNPQLANANDLRAGEAVRVQ